MALSKDLLDQARWLSRREPRRPKQASLRRAVSTAYYAVFHLLISEVGVRFAPGPLRAFQGLFQRTLEHAKLKEACEHVVNVRVRNVPPKLSLASVQVSNDLHAVAFAFTALQQARHNADYNTVMRFSRVEVAGLVATAENTFLAWQRIRGGAEADAFLALLLLWGRTRS